MSVPKPETASYHGPPAGTSVWLVDDSPLEAGFAARALAPFNVEVFHDGTSMLERLASGRAPDVLVLDWHMPGLSGVEICAYLRSNPATATIPILLLTVLSDTRDVVEGLRAGADDYVKKPYASEELVARVESLVRSVNLRRRAEDAEASVSLLLEHLPDALLMLDEHQSIVFANETAKRVLRADVVGRPLREVIPQLSPIGDHLAPAADVELDGRIYAPVVGAVPGPSKRLAIALRDVTEKRGLEARRLDFYSIVAHDLRTPLAAVLLRNELMLRGSRGVLPAQARDEVERIRRRLKQMAELVDDFLELARADATGIKLDAAPVDLSQVVREAVEHLHSVADDAGLSVTTAGIDAPATIVGDARRLRQVVSNLLGNAIKFTPPGGSVELSIERRPSEVEVSVRDTGVGIPPESLPILFQRYARAVDARSVTGTGLGLMIVRELVEAHRGRVGVESEVGRGSRFWFTIPTGDRTTPLQR